MNTEAAIISLTEKSLKSAYKLSEIFDKSKIYVMEKHKYKLNDEYFLTKKENTLYYQNLNMLVSEIFSKYKIIIFVMAVGIVVRTISKHIDDKATDPAVIVCDEKLKFAISILSGHIGGANNVCKHIAEKTSAIPVITTATDINEKSALDNIALKLNAFRNKDRDIYKKVNYMLANGEKVYLLSDIKLSDDMDLRGFTLLKEKADLKEEFLVHISYRQNTKFQTMENYAKIIPKCVCLGIGCRKDTSYEDLKANVFEYLKENNIDLNSISIIASIDIKKEEKSIITLSEELGADFVTFTAQEILASKYYKNIEKNEFVRKITGVDSVSLACAKILSKDNIIGSNLRKNGITVSIGIINI